MLRRNLMKFMRCCVFCLVLAFVSTQSVLAFGASCGGQAQAAIDFRVIEASYSNMAGQLMAFQEGDHLVLKIRVDETDGDTIADFLRNGGFKDSPSAHPYHLQDRAFKRGRKSQTIVEILVGVGTLAALRSVIGVLAQCDDSIILAKLSDLVHTRDGAPVVVE